MLKVSALFTTFEFQVALKVKSLEQDVIQQNLTYLSASCDGYPGVTGRNNLTFLRFRNQTNNFIFMIRVLSKLRHFLRLASFCLSAGGCAGVSILSAAAANQLHQRLWEHQTGPRPFPQQPARTILHSPEAGTEPLSQIMLGVYCPDKIPALRLSVYSLNNQSLKMSSGVSLSEWDPGAVS